MLSKNQIRSYFRPVIECSTRSLLGAALLLLLCSNPLAAQNAPETVTIKLPYDGPDMRFKAVYLGIDGTKFFATRKITLGSREENAGYKEQMVDTLLSGSFIGKRNGKSDWLYYLGETEVSQGQWDSVMRWMDDQQKGKALTAKKSDKDNPKTGATVAEIYSFIEALNTWMLQEQSSSLPRFYNAKAFCRLPTEAEWEFAARGGIEVDKVVFDRPHPYGEQLGKYEWHRGNTNSKVRECGSRNIQPNPVGLKDMLGNVEELTVNLFSPEYQQGRFGQFVIRGNNYSDSPDNFAASHRTEFASHNPEGNLRRPPNVGFRLALSTSIASTGKTPEELGKEFEDYSKKNPLPRPGLTGQSSPAKQAEEDTIHFSQGERDKIEEKNRKLTEEMGRLETLQRDDQEKCAATEQMNRELNETNSQLAKEISKLQNSLASNPTTAEVKTLQEQLEVLRKKNQTIAEKLKNMPEKGKSEKVFVSYENTQELSRQLKDKEEALRKKEQELKAKEEEFADFKRQRELYSSELVKNAARVREVEKRYLEALMRQAYSNAYNAYVQLVKRQDIYLPGKDPDSQKKAEKAYSQACQYLHDYWKLVQKIAQETKEDLFPEVKQEVSDWLRKGEQENIFSEECKIDNGQQRLSDIQRKSLDLIERHVQRVRAGGSRFPDDLIDTFIEQPDFR